MAENIEEKKIDENNIEEINLEPDHKTEELIVEDELNPENVLEENELKEEDNTSNENNTSDYELDNQDPSEYSVQKKQTKFQKILMITIAILLGLLTIGLILYFLGFFDAPKKVEVKNEIKKVEVKENKKEFEFKSRDIDASKLNDKFSKLTKYDKSLEEKKAYEVERKKALEEDKKREETLAQLKSQIEKQQSEIKQKQEELKKEKDELLSMKSKILEEVKEKKEELEGLLKEKEAMNNKMIMPEANFNEEEIEETEKITNDHIEVAKENKVPESKNEVIEEKPKNTFLKLINVATIKGNLTKSYLNKIEKIDTQINLCRDNNNNIEVYIGPFEMSENRFEVLNRFLNSGFKNALEVDLTKKEFEKRCKY